MEDDFV